MFLWPTCFSERAIDVRNDLSQCSGCTISSDAFLDHV